MTSAGTTKRGIRIPDALWAEFQDATEAAGTNPSETIRQLIRDWIKQHKGDDKDEGRHNHNRGRVLH